MKGSLTTPECSEVVEWIVVDNPIFGISEDQLLQFQSLEDRRGYPVSWSSAIEINTFGFKFYFKHRY
jgi:carbonic anhydrase